jgi:hypothetical protein
MPLQKEHYFFIVDEYKQYKNMLYATNRSVFFECYNNQIGFSKPKYD